LKRFNFFLDFATVGAELILGVEVGLLVGGLVGVLVLAFLSLFPDLALVGTAVR
jgi:hypothetical protein